MKAATSILAIRSVSPAKVCTIAAFLVPGPASAQELATWTLAEDLRIGSIDRPDYALTSITDIEVAPDGRILVAQHLDSNIRVFDERGRYVYTIGRPGGGPGELQGVGSLHYRAGKLFVRDSRQARLHEFTVNGEHLKSWRAPAASLPEGLGMRPPHARLRDGTLVMEPSYWMTETRQARAIPILQFDTAGTLLRTLAVLTAGDEGRRTRVGNLGAVVPQPVTSRSLWATMRDGGGVLVAHRTFGNDESPGIVRLLRIDTEGDTTLMRSYRVPVTRIDMSRVADSIQAIAEYTSRVRPFPREQIVEMYRTGWQIPDYQSPIDRIVAGMDGTTWLQRGAFMEREVVWWILDARGDVIARVRTPAALKLMRMGTEHVWGATIGDIGEMYVVRLRIVRPDNPQRQPFPQRPQPRPLSYSN